MPKLSVVAKDGGPPPRSEARQRLADLLAEQRERHARRNGLATAYSTAEAAVRAARTRLDDAREAVETATSAAAEFLTAQAMGRDMPPPVTMKAARAAEQDASDDLAAASAALERINEQLGEARANEWKDGAVAEAARAVLLESPAVVRAVETVERLQREMIEAGQVLLWLTGEHVITNARPGTASYDGSTLYGRARTACARLESPPQWWGGLMQDASLMQRRMTWQTTLAALMQNADAPLPGEAR